jgi:hypothetical protein
MKTKTHKIISHRTDTTVSLSELHAIGLTTSNKVVKFCALIRSPAEGISAEPVFCRGGLSGLVVTQQRNPTK